MYLTTADLLVRGLGLGPLATPPVLVPRGTNCAITGQPLDAGYPVADMVTDATAEFLDCFRGGVDGWVSDSAARCFKNSDPRKGNPTARSVLIFEDGTCYIPLINRQSAIEQGRVAWSDLVRSVWPGRKGQLCLAMLTTDNKKRLWIRARVGQLGERTPLLGYDAETALNEVLFVDWRLLVEVLSLVEEVYGLGFAKSAIRASLYRHSSVVDAVGLAETRRYERALAVARGRPEFGVAVLIAQRDPDKQQGGMKRGGRYKRPARWWRSGCGRGQGSIAFPGNGGLRRWAIWCCGPRSGVKEMS